VQGSGEEGEERRGRGGWREGSEGEGEGEERRGRNGRGRGREGEEERGRKIDCSKYMYV